MRLIRTVSRPFTVGRNETPVASFFRKHFIVYGLNRVVCYFFLVVGFHAQFGKNHPSTSNRRTVPPVNYKPITYVAEACTRADGRMRSSKTCRLR